MNQLLNKVNKTILVLLLALPSAVFAAGLTPTSFNSFESFVGFIITTILGPIIPFFTALSVVYFIWGSIKYFMHAEDLKNREEGRTMMIMGVVAIFVIITFWGFAKLLVSAFGF